METFAQTPQTAEALVSAPDLKSVFGSEGNLESIEALRDRQREAYEHAIEVNKDFSDDSSKFFSENAVKFLITEHLAKNGIAEDNPKYTELHDGLIALSILSTPESDWSATLDKDDPTKTGLSGRDRARALYEQVTGESYYALPSERSDVDQEVLATWRTELDDLRNKVVALSATRQGRIFGSGGEKYKEAKQAYNDQMIALAKLENESVIANTNLSDDEKKLQITKYLFAEQARLRTATTEKLKGTKVGRFVEAMNRGNIAIRIAKGFALGIGVGLAGAGIGALAGVAGAATLGAGVATVGTATVRFARGFARKDAGEAGRGMAELDPSTHSIDTSTSGSDDGYIDATAQHLDNLFETDTKLEQKKRRSSVRWGIGALALGAVAAEAGHLVVDTNWFHGWMNRNDLPSLGGHHNLPSGTKPSVQDMNNGASGHGLVPDQGSGASELPPTHLAPEFGIDAHTVMPGEGWYQTFSDMGIKNATEQANLLQKVGPKLQEMGYAYKMPHGLWGISRPGQLPNDVLELIKNSR